MFLEYLALLNGKPTGGVGWGSENARNAEVSQTRAPWCGAFRCQRLTGAEFAAPLGGRWGGGGWERPCVGRQLLGSDITGQTLFKGCPSAGEFGLDWSEALVLLVQAI